MKSRLEYGHVNQPHSILNVCLLAIHGCPKSFNYWRYQSNVTVFAAHEALLSSPLRLFLLLGTGRIRQAILNLILAVQSTPAQSILHTYVQGNMCTTWLMATVPIIWIRSLVVGSLRFRFSPAVPLLVSCSSPDSAASFRATLLGPCSTLMNTERLSLAEDAYSLVQTYLTLCPIPFQSSRRPFWSRAQRRWADYTETWEYPLGYYCEYI